MEGVALLWRAWPVLQRVPWCGGRGLDVQGVTCAVQGGVLHRGWEPCLSLTESRPSHRVAKEERGICPTLASWTISGGV